LRNASTEPLSSFGLPTPHHKRKITVEPDGEEANQQNKVKKSAKMKEKNSKNMSINKLAQEVLAQNCGIIREDEDLDDMTLQQYIDMYEHPLNEESLQAILKLTEVATEKKKKKEKNTIEKVDPLQD
jgi:arsenate reductase-like glutaredoxin family protein